MYIFIELLDHIKCKNFEGMKGMFSNILSTYVKFIVAGAFLLAIL